MKLYIGDLYGRLLDTARQKVRSGAVTERGLARLCGLSQPHMHNVLKSIRSMSPEAADRLMHALDLNVSALIFQSFTGNETEITLVPVIRNRIGPGIGAVFTVFRGFMPFSTARLTPLVDPVVAQLAPDLMLPKVLAPNDYVLLDQNPEVRERVTSPGCWVIAENGAVRVRYVKLMGNDVCVANTATLRDAARWHPIPLKGRNILEIVRARVVSISREMETAPAAPSDPPGSSD